MKINHHHFQVEIDTESEDIQKTFKDLDKYYSQIPPTRCNFCPHKKGVEADCCKHFSPPMYLIEFINIYKEILKLPKKEQFNLLIDCFKSYMNPTIVKPCPLLVDTACTAYNGRPFSCRMYGQYPASEWKKRLESTSKRWKMPEEEIPMKDQCGEPNITFPDKNRKPITVEKEAEIFRNITDLDKVFFEDKKIASEIVYSALTYLTFDEHYILIKMGPDMLDKLFEIKTYFKEKYDNFKAGIIDKLELKKVEIQVEEFVNAIENQIRLSLFSGISEEESA